MTDVEINEKMGLIANMLNGMLKDALKERPVFALVFMTKDREFHSLTNLDNADHLEPFMESYIEGSESGEPVIFNYNSSKNSLN